MYVYIHNKDMCHQAQPTTVHLCQSRYIEGDFSYHFSHEVILVQSRLAANATEQDGDIC